MRPPVEVLAEGVLAPAIWGIPRIPEPKSRVAGGPADSAWWRYLTKNPGVPNAGM